MLSFKLTLVKVLKGWDGLQKISTFSQNDGGIIIYGKKLDDFERCLEYSDNGKSFDIFM